MFNCGESLALPPRERAVVRFVNRRAQLARCAGRARSAGPCVPHNGSLSFRLVMAAGNRRDDAFQFWWNRRGFGRKGRVRRCPAGGCHHGGLVGACPGVGAGCGAALRAEVPWGFSGVGRWCGLPAAVFSVSSWLGVSLGGALGGAFPVTGVAGKGGRNVLSLRGPDREAFRPRAGTNRKVSPERTPSWHCPRVALTTTPSFQAPNPTPAFCAQRCPAAGLDETIFGEPASGIEGPLQAQCPWLTERVSPS